MKKYLINDVIVFFTLILSVWGCAGHRQAHFSINDDGSVSHQDTNISILEPSISPEELTQAEINHSQAEINYAVAKMMANGIKSGKLNFNYSIGFVNHDPDKDVYFWNPEFPSQKIILKHNGGTYLLGLNTLPSVIKIYYSGKVIKTVSPMLDRTNNIFTGGNGYKLMFNGMEVDIRYAVAKVY